MGGTKLGKFSLSLKAGFNAALHRLGSDAIGLPDTLGLLADDSRFTFVRFYVEPRLTYKTRDINIELTPTTEYFYEKYSEDNGNHQMLFAPDLSIRWYCRTSSTSIRVGRAIVTAIRSPSVGALPTTTR